MKTRELMKLSKVVDKMDFDISAVVKNKGLSEEETGMKLISELFGKIHRAEDEVLELIAESKGITVDEASEVDVIKFLKEYFSSFSGFFRNVPAATPAEVDSAVEQNL